MLKTKVENKVLDLLVQASVFQEFEIPDIEFNLRGKSAGLCRYGYGKCLLRFNLKLLTENQKDFLKITVPHEVAHYVAFVLFGKVQPHGEEWKTIMKFFGIENPSRCHDFKTTDPWKYKCSCQEHFLSSIQHARVGRGARYSCLDCKEELKFVGKNT